MPSPDQGSLNQSLLHTGDAESFSVPSSPNVVSVRCEPSIFNSCPRAYKGPQDFSQEHFTDLNVSKEGDELDLDVCCDCEAQEQAGHDKTIFAPISDFKWAMVFI